jgi:peptidoglycan/LPS O-acetylase OafA/YrhL
MRGYKPALDGIRALAVIAVLLFHGEAGAPGGFLGVSVFFTLSGYLITSLLLAEHARTGTIGLREFYARRLRRLMPAAFVCFALVLALGPWWTATQRRDLPGDLLAALLDVANWRFAFADTSYQELFIGAPSPVAHFWSLAIEEQFYLVLPLIATVALRRSRRTLALTAWTLLGASIAATVLTSDRDLVYNGTHTRAAELLFGVVLAMLPLRRRSVQRVLRVASPVALAALIVVVLKATVADSWLYDGGLVFVGLTSAILVGGVAHGGPLARVLGNPTLAAVGRISYGLYLFHWPIFLVLSESRVGVGGAPLLVLRLAASFAAAAVSYRILELPVRHRRLLPRPGPAGLAAGGSLAALALAAFVAVPSPRFTETEELLQEGAAGEVISLTPTTDASGRLLSDEAEAVLSGSSRSPTGGGTGDGDGAAPSTRVTVPEPTVGVGVPGTDDRTETTRSRPGAAPSTAAPTTVTSTVPSTAAAPPVSSTTATEPPRPPRVLVVGSDEGPLAALAAAATTSSTACSAVVRSRPPWRYSSTTAPSCRPPHASRAPCSGNASLPAASPDVVVVSTGPVDRAATRGPGDAGFARPQDLVAQARRLDAEESDLRAAIDAVTRVAPTSGSSTTAATGRRASSTSAWLASASATSRCATSSRATMRSATRSIGRSPATQEFAPSVCSSSATRSR